MVKVSVICPTYNRHDLHEKLYHVFETQKYADRELLVLDDSIEASPFFASLKDERVKYFHQGRATIGAKRNALCAMAKGEIIAHFDDDDYYAPVYLEEMVKNLGDADLVKLSKWLAWRETDGTLWAWDTRFIAENHYLISGKHGRVLSQNFREKIKNPEEFLEMNLWGYGFSYVYRKTLWEECPFENVNFGEDYLFILHSKMLGKNLIHVPDEAHMTLHTLHPRGTSLIFPQENYEQSKALEMLGEGALPWMVNKR